MTSCTIDLICLHGMGEIDMSITTKAKCFDCLPGKIVDNFIVVNSCFAAFIYEFLLQVFSWQHLGWKSKQIEARKGCANKEEMRFSLHNSI